MGVDGIFCPIRKNLWLGNFLNLELNTRLPASKIRKLDVDAFRLEAKRFKSQIHLIIISRDCGGPTGSNLTGVLLLPQAKFEFKDSSIQQILPDMLPLSTLICQCMRQFFVKRLKFFISNFQFTCGAKFSAFG